MKNMSGWAIGFLCFLVGFVFVFAVPAVLAKIPATYGEPVVEKAKPKAMGAIGSGGHGIASAVGIFSAVQAYDGNLIYLQVTDRARYIACL